MYGCNISTTSVQKLLTPAIAKTAIVNPNRMVTESCLLLFFQSHTAPHTNIKMNVSRNSMANPWATDMLALMPGEHTPAALTPVSLLMAPSRNFIGVTSCDKSRKS